MQLQQQSTLHELSQKNKGEKMTHYLYPQNLTAKSKIWLWEIKDFIILCIALLLAVILLVLLGWIPPIALTLCGAILTIKKDDITLLDFIKYCVRYFISKQQYFEWR